MNKTWRVACGELSALSLGVLVVWTGSYFCSNDRRGGGIGKSRCVVLVSCASRHVNSAAESSLRAYVRLLLLVDYLSYWPPHPPTPPHHGTTVRNGPGPPHCRDFTTILSRTPQGEWSARRRDFYMTTHNTHKRQTSMSRAEFEPTFPAGERPQTHSSDRAVNAVG